MGLPRLIPSPRTLASEVQASCVILRRGSGRGECGGAQACSRSRKISEIARLTKPELVRVKLRIVCMPGISPRHAANHNCGFTKARRFFYVQACDVGGSGRLAIGRGSVDAGFRGAA